LLWQRKWLVRNSATHLWHSPIVVDSQLIVCYALSSMNVFDFYKLITDSIASYLMFVAFMFAMYMLSSIFIAFCTSPGKTWSRNSNKFIYLDVDFAKIGRIL
jgi:hypothetical protein